MIAVCAFVPRFARREQTLPASRQRAEDSARRSSSLWLEHRSSGSLFGQGGNFGSRASQCRPVGHYVSYGSWWTRAQVTVVTVYRTSKIEKYWSKA